jgi:hypothetical protein
MAFIDWAVLTLTFILIGSTLVWVYKKRHRLFNNAQFTAETCYRYFQTEDKQQAIDAMLYQKQEEKEDLAGEDKLPGSSNAPKP